MRLKQKSGFTLIELLVVIAIIGILSAIGLVALSSSQARARDAKRKADIQSLSTILAGDYLNAYSSFPLADVAAGAAPDWGPIWVAEANTNLATASTTPSPSYAGFAIPRSPNQGGVGTSNDYWYVTDAVGLKFAFWTKLEAGNWFVFNNKGFADEVLNSATVAGPPDRSGSTQCTDTYTAGKTFSPCLSNPVIQ